jgi:uncharacterized protein
VSDTEQLLAMQALDSALDDCANRRTRLAERETLSAARARLAAANAALKGATAQATAATARIEELEHLGAARDTKKARLNAQLKTVIAPREAEALMHEIATLDAERSVADDEELTLMDAVEAADAAASEARAQIADGESDVASATASLADAEASIDAEVATLSSQRADLVAEVPAAVVNRYEALRKTSGGIAITRIAAGRCGACHLDQSRSTIEALRSGGEGATVECEQCGRLLAG